MVLKDIVISTFSIFSGLFFSQVYGYIRLMISFSVFPVKEL